jgi:hypothetical protein
VTSFDSSFPTKAPPRTSSPTFTRFVGNDSSSAAKVPSTLINPPRTATSEYVEARRKRPTKRLAGIGGSAATTVRDSHAINHDNAFYHGIMIFGGNFYGNVGNGE